MIDPKTIDFNQLPKKFCDGAVGAFGKDIFAFCLTSGNALESFATNPQTMKSIAEFFKGQVENYEKQHGMIDMTPSPIPSPLQSPDLGGNENRNK